MLTRWDPFEEMNRLTSRLFGGGGEGREWRPVITPAVDVFEDEDRIELRAELPGMKADEVKIEVADEVLTLSGERRLDRDEREEGFRRIERSYGRFQRSFTLPSNVDADNVRAEMREGVLYLTLPKREQQKGRRIPVLTEGAREEKRQEKASQPNVRA